MKQEEKKSIISSLFRSVVKEKKVIKIGDKGLYNFITTLDNLSENISGQKCDVFVKIEVVDVYGTMVEIKMLEIDISSHFAENVKNFISSSLPKYIQIKDIKWQNEQ